jgi:hypothetical protein
MAMMLFRLVFLGLLLLLAAVGVLILGAVAAADPEPMSRPLRLTGTGIIVVSLFGILVGLGAFE